MCIQKAVGPKGVPRHGRRVRWRARNTWSPLLQNGALSGSTLMLLDVSPSEEVCDERDDKQNEKDVEDDFRNSGGGDGDAAEPKDTGNDCDHEKG